MRLRPASTTLVANMGRVLRSHTLQRTVLQKQMNIRSLETRYLGEGDVKCQQWKEDYVGSGVLLENLLNPVEGWEFYLRFHNHFESRPANDIGIQRAHEGFEKTIISIKIKDIR